MPTRRVLHNHLYRSDPMASPPCPHNEGQNRTNVGRTWPSSAVTITERESNTQTAKGAFRIIDVNSSTRSRRRQPRSTCALKMPNADSLG